MSRFILYLLLLVSKLLFSQDVVWSLQDCIILGQNKAFDYKIKALEVTQAQKENQSYWHSLVPQISFGGNHTYQFGSTIDPTTNTRVNNNFQFDSFGINASLNLLNFRELAQNKQTQLKEDWHKIDQKRLENEFQLKLIELFFETIYTQELLALKKIQFKNLIEIINRSQKEIDAGARAKSDEYDFKIQQHQEEISLLQTQNQYNQLKINLCFWINENKINVENLILNPFTSENIEIVENPKVKLAQLAVDLSKQELKLIKAENKPTLSARYGLSSFYASPLGMPEAVNPFFNQLENNRMNQVSLQLDIPIFGGVKQKRVIKAKKINLEIEIQKLEKEKQNQKNNLKTESNNLENYNNQLNVMKNQLSWSEKSYQAAIYKFNVGQIDPMQLQMARNQNQQIAYDVLRLEYLQTYSKMRLRYL
jgi:outer membrane protein